MLDHSIGSWPGDAADGDRLSAPAIPGNLETVCHGRHRDRQLSGPWPCFLKRQYGGPDVRHDRPGIFYSVPAARRTGGRRIGVHPPLLRQQYFDRKAGTTPDKADWDEIKAELAGIKRSSGGKSALAQRAAKGGSDTAAKTKADIKEAERVDKPTPKAYALLPFTPLVLLIVFSPFVITSIKMNVATAMIISGMLAVICEMIRYRSFQRGADAFSVFFEGMGRQFVNIVTLIVGGQMFAAGLTQLGFISFIIDGAERFNMGAIPITIIMTLVIFLSAVLMGSGNAPWFAFSELIPDIAKPLGVDTVFLAQPMELASGIGRSMSPIAGVVIAVAGLGDVSPVDLVKRTIPVMIPAYVIMVTSSIVWDYLLRALI